MAKAHRHGLLTYVARRLLLMIPTFIGITFVVFLLCQFVPGGPIDQLRMQLAGGGGGGETGISGGRTLATTDIPASQLKVLNEYYGFDKPILVRYLYYLKNLFQGNLGDSFRYTRPVFGLIVDRMPISISYGLVTTLLTYFICVPLGLLKAIKHKAPVDTFTSVLIFVGYSIPGFALGAVLLAYCSVKNDWFPLAGIMSENFAELSAGGKIRDILHHATLPLICYSIHLFAVMTILMKNSILENMSADYVKTALAKGVTWPRAVFGHALRNSLIPLATSFGHNLSLLLAGSLLIETVFSIEGMGRLSWESLLARDYPVVMGLAVISAILFLLGNLLSDLTVATVDPRVRFE
jgi:microcin C transport system permease protein